MSVSCQAPQEEGVHARASWGTGADVLGFYMHAYMEIIALGNIT